MISSGFKQKTLPFDISTAELESISCVAAAEVSRNEVKKSLLRCGAVLIRGLGINGPADFDAFVRALSGKEPFSYAGGTSPRVASRNKGIYTSTEYPPSLKIPLHNELSYSSVYPDHIYFWCLEAAESGGATTLGDSRQILANIDPQIVSMFKERKVRYVRTLGADRGSGYSWQDAFETADRNRVERICTERGAEFEWTESGLVVSEIRPATTVHPFTGEEVWFNQADGFHESNVYPGGLRPAGAPVPRLQSFFGDGSPICLSILKGVRSVIDRQTTEHRWENGDLLVLDNRLAAHGRMPFEGTRKILVAMT